LNYDFARLPDFEEMWMIENSLGSHPFATYFTDQSLWVISVPAHTPGVQMASRFSLHNDLRPNDTSPKIAQEQINMTIRYSNGYTVEAVPLSRGENVIRVEVRGGSDVLELRQINGQWITEDCEPVEVNFGWVQHKDVPVVTINDCICSPELAAKLLHMLFSGEDAPAAIDAIDRAASVNGAPVCHQVV
jgi:hypothetical protein